MASSSLQSASSYLNNLLLSRGLLQHGKSIAFHQPDAHGDSEATMSRVINLVHDLVLRRDRDAEQREILVSNLKSLRAEESQRLIDLQRTQDKNGELARDLVSAEAAQRALRLSVKKAETQVRELREQMAKMKSTLDQVRAKCISDVRKRDVELEKLKGHLGGMQRGKKEASGMKINMMNPRIGVGRERGAQETGDQEWSLEKETNDFLAAIVNETSMENVTLRGIVSGTMDTLKEMTGLNHEEQAGAEDGIGMPGQYRLSRKPDLDESQDSIVPCKTLAQQMTTILEHCRSILKDPSFVPIEEVHLREEEIVKLRIGWEKMASRWKEAVTMMDSWRQRMLDGDEKIDMEELSNLDFGRSVAVLPNGDPVLGQDDGLSSALFDSSHVSAREISEELETPLQHTESEHQDDESELDIPPEPSPKRLHTSPARRGIKLPRPTRTLREINTNTNIHRPSEHSPPSSSSHAADSGIGSLDGHISENDRSRSRPTKIPRHASVKTPPVSVAEKLAAVEAEAQAAEQTRRQEGGRKRKARPVGVKKGRRRSTLSPEELAGLMGRR